MLYDETNLDWVPNINMGYLRKYPQQDRHSRLEQRKRRRLVTEVQDEIESERASLELVSRFKQSKRRQLVTEEQETQDEVETEVDQTYWACQIMSLNVCQCNYNLSQSILCYTTKQMLDLCFV